MKSLKSIALVLLSVFLLISSSQTFPVEEEKGILDGLGSTTTPKPAGGLGGLPNLGQTVGS